MARRKARKAPPEPSYLGHGDLATSLLLIAPLFLVYEVGVMFSTSMNGVDFVTRGLYGALGSTRLHFLIAQAVLAGIYLLLLMQARRRRQVDAEQVLPMLLESAIYALTLGTFIVFVMQRLLGFWINIDHLALGSTGEAVVVALGAGVHEELVFRLGLMAGGAALLARTGMSRRVALPLALVVSALAFSAAHHLGPHGEPFTLSVFTYRALAGTAFGLIFYYRSLSHAVYTHFLYDLYVLVLR